MHLMCYEEKPIFHGHTSDNLMTYVNLTPKTLAKIVEKAARLREESFDHIAADKVERYSRLGK